MKGFLFRLAILMLIILHVFTLSAVDFGLMSNQIFSVDGKGTDGDSARDGLAYSATLNPWLTAPLGPSSGGFGKLYLSAAVTADYAHSTEEWTFIPELLRTEAVFRMAGMMEISAGRMFYSDSLGFVANGLFDGVRFSLDLRNKGIFGAGIWYTGLLYKETTEITMTGEDMFAFSKVLDYSDFTNTYFASRRLLAALDWDNPNLAEWLGLQIALISQTDLTGNKNRYHSQYLTAKATIPAGNFVFGLGICAELSEYLPDSSFEDSDTQVKVGLAGELELGWMLPATSIQDQLTLAGRFSSGTVKNSTFGAFVPVTTHAQGDILQAKLSGLSAIMLNYLARLNRNFSVFLGGTYFILSDKGTYEGYPAGKEGYFLGSEFFGRLIWSPVSDLMINLGGGVFLPSLGNAGSKENPLWRMELSVTLMIY